MRYIFFIGCVVTCFFNLRLGLFLFFVWSCIVDIYDELTFNPATNPNYTNRKQEEQQRQQQAYEEQMRREYQTACANAYATLGISSTATDDEVRKAYRKLAMCYHPDRNCAPSAAESFRKVQAAYEMIKNIRRGL